jgi:hypothetical protein
MGADVLETCHPTAGETGPCWPGSQSRSVQAASIAHVPGQAFSVMRSGTKEAWDAASTPVPGHVSDPCLSPSVYMHRKAGCQGGDTEMTESALTAQYQRTDSAWPFVHQAGLVRGLPRRRLQPAPAASGAGPGRPVTTTGSTSGSGCTSCSGSPVTAVVADRDPGRVPPRPGPGVTLHQRCLRSRGPEENRRDFRQA